MFYFFAIKILLLLLWITRQSCILDTMAPAVQKVANTIHQINLYQVDSAILVSQYVSTK